MANPFERCLSIWHGTDKKEPFVRCDRWGGHGGEHRGFDDQDIAYCWPNFDGHEELPKSHVHVPWNQPVPDNLEVDEDVRAVGERERIQELEKLVEEFKRQAEEQAEALLHAERARDTEAKNAMTLMGQLEDAMDRLRRIRNLTNGVPDENPLNRFLRTQREHRADA